MGFLPIFLLGASYVSSGWSLNTVFACLKLSGSDGTIKCVTALDTLAKFLLDTNTWRRHVIRGDLQQAFTSIFYAHVCTISHACAVCCP